MRHENGFTLIELLVVLAVAAVLLTIGVPSLRTLMQNSRLVTEVNGIVAHINLARSEAVKRRVPVSICYSADASAEPPTCADDQTNWTGGAGSGLLVFVDDSDDGVFDADETLIRRSPREGAGASVGTNGQPLRFRPDGTLTTGNIVQFGVCDERGPDDRSARAVDVVPVGRAATLRGPLPDAYAGLCPQ